MSYSIACYFFLEKFDAGFDMCDNGQTDTAGPASQAIVDIQQHGIADINSLSRKLPSGSDFLIAYATVPGKGVCYATVIEGGYPYKLQCTLSSYNTHYLVTILLAP